MAYYATTITFGSLTLLVEKVRPRKLPRTRKQWINGRLIEVRIPFLDDQDWELRITGFFHGADRDADRRTLEGYADGDKVLLTDGEHNGDYIIRPESLNFNDDRSANPARHAFTMVLIQNQ